MKVTKNRKKVIIKVTLSYTLETKLVIEVRYDSLLLV